MKIKLNSIDPNKITDDLVVYFDFLEKLENKFSFAFDNDIGYLSSIPSNVGASTFFNVKLKIANKVENFEKIGKSLEESLNDLAFDFEKKNEDFTVLTLSNKSPYYSFANLLIDLIKIKDYLN